jgi:hypothetical protein
MLKNKYGENIFVNFKDLKYNKNGMIACCFFYGHLVGLNPQELKTELESLDVEQAAQKFRDYFGQYVEIREND